jgi:energy-coupling factor transporter transmembrane protein EcfT
MSTKLLSAFVPGLGAAYAVADTGNMVLKGILFLILLILSIVSLTGKGAGIIVLCVIIFIMTLILPFRVKLGINTNIKVMGYLGLYFLFALLATILSYNKVKSTTDEGELKKIKNSARSTTGIVVLVGIYMLGAIYAFKMADAGVKLWAAESYFLK